MSIDVVLPCLNEAAALPWILDRMPTGYRPIVVDNGSSDGSSHVARRCGAVVIEVSAPGYGAACHAGIIVATSSIVCVMDADATLDPVELPQLVEPIVNGLADLVIGRRRPTERRAFPAHARAGNAALVFMLRRRGILTVHDVGPMRAANRAQLLALDIEDRRFGYPLELVVRAADAGYRIAERDVSYRPRVGRSKVTGTWRGTARTIRDMRRVLAA